MNIETAGNAGKLQDIYTTVVYDQASGEIVHLHQTIVFEGAKVPSEKEQAEQALTQAEATGLDRSRTSALHLGKRMLDPEREYRVDPAARSLVEGTRVARQGLDNLRRK